MEYRILGPLEIIDDDGAPVDLRRSKPRAAIALMLTRPNEVVSVDRFIEVLWANSPPVQPQQALQVHISRLRSSLGRADVVVTRNPGYLLRVAPDELDAEVAELLIREGLRAAEEGVSELAVQHLGEALSLWRGEALVDFLYEDFALGEIERLTELRLVAVESLIEAELAMGLPGGGLVPELESLVTEHPLRERLWMALMLALYRSGRQADALRAFGRAERILGSELGIEPSPSLRELEEQILLHDARLDHLPVPAVHAGADPVLPSGRVTFLFVEALGQDAQSVEVRAEVTDAVVAHGGVVERTAGGRLYSAFQVIDDAVAAAAFVHRRRGDLVRSALHTDETSPTGHRYVGHAPNHCAAVLGLGGDGQLLATLAVVESAASATVTFTDVGDYLVDGSGPHRIYQVLGEGMAEAPSPLRATPLSRSNLTDPLTTFVGREREVSELSSLVAHKRLVTITGPGGVGKSRLAVRVGSQARTYRDGTWRVALADGVEDRFVASSLARVLNVEESGAETRALVLDDLAHRQCLVIFDDCDAVLDSTAELVEAILADCPAVTVLVTSRERLGVVGEAVYPLTALTLSAPSPDSAVVASVAESVQLLCDRAQAVDPRFRLTDDNAAAVATICALLDGLPLALELAAARLDVMTPEELARRLEDSLEVLVGGRRAFVPRHRTMSDVVDWSVRLLASDVQAFAADLTVMAGPFDLAGAEAVTEATGALGMLANLSAKSLLMQTRAGERTLFHLPRPVRDRLVRLLPSNELERLQARHLAHYRSMAEQAKERIRTPEGASVLDELDGVHAQLASALDRALDRDPEGALIMAASLWRFWLQRGHIARGRAWLENALQAAPPDSSAMIEALHGAGVLAYAQGDYVAAGALRRDELALARRAGDELATASALVFLGSLARINGDARVAAEMLEEGLALQRSLEDGRGMASALSMLGAVGEFESPLIELCRESIDIFRRRGDDWGTATSLWYLATVVIAEDRSAGKALMLEAGNLFTELGDRRGSAQCLLELASVADELEATRLLAASHTLWSRSEFAPTPAEQRKIAAAKTRLQRRLGERFAIEWQAGESLSAEDAFSLVAQPPPSGT